MAATKKTTNATQAANPGRVTHYPHSNGTVCGKRLNKAADYDPVAPTCRTCAAWLAETIAFTKRKHPSAFARQPAAEAPSGEES